VTKRFAVLTSIFSMALLGVACSSSNDSSNTNASVVTETTTTNSANTSTSPAPETAPSPISNASAADDSSIETVTSPAGVKTETRTFRNNARVSKVVVTTDKSGVRRARVYSATGEQKELPESKVGEALSATGDALASSAGFVADKSKEAYNASKKGTEKAVDKTVDVSKTVGEKTVDVSKDVANKTVDVSKTVGRKTAEGAKTVGEKTAEGAKKTGRAIKKAVTP
jgi:hypothetical protein